MRTRQQPCQMEHNPNGDFALAENSTVHSGSGQGGQMLTFSGIGVYDPALFADTPPHQAAKLAPLLRAAMDAGQVSGEAHQGLWLDVGTPERLAEADRLAQGW